MSKKESKGNSASFMQKMYNMTDDKSLSDVISWGEDGSSIVIYNITDFTSQVLPMYFKHSNLASFIR